MSHQFTRHYTAAEARALLPQVRRWLDQLVELRRALARQEEQLAPRLNAGNDLGGPAVTEWLSTLGSLKSTLGEFQAREILLKDLDRGLVDFPSFRDGREVFLCWEQGEEDIEFWHDLDAGYAGRERL